MAKTRQEKKKIIEELKKEINRQKIMIFLNFKSLKANEVFSLREKLKKTNSCLKVAKKTLLKKVLKEKKLEFEEKKLEGEIAVVFGFEEEISPTKVVCEFSRENKNLKILGGFLENKFREPEEIIAISQIPSKEALLVKLIGSISSPISGFLNVLKGNIQEIIQILYQLSQSKVNQ